VFVLGGATYTELSNLRMFAERVQPGQSRKFILFGSTEIVNAEQFAGQLARMSQPSAA